MARNKETGEVGKSNRGFSAAWSVLDMFIEAMAALNGPISGKSIYRATEIHSFLSFVSAQSQLRNSKSQTMTKL